MQVDLTQAIVQFKKDVVLEEVKRRAEAGDNALEILDESREGMTIVGNRFQKGDAFLAELVLSADIFKNIVNILDPYLSKTGTGKVLGKVIMATLKGDIHDLGKGIVVTVLKAKGFEVHDLGIDIHSNVVIEKVKEINPDVIGFSSLLTTTLPVMKETVDLLSAEGLRNKTKVMIGGGITTPQTKEYVGADFQSIDAIEALNFCLKVTGGE